MNPTLLLLTLLLLGCSAGADGGASEPLPERTSFDLSTDEGVQAAYHEATGETRYAYLHRSDRLPGIILINDRIPDSEEIFIGVFVDGRWYPDEKALQPVLVALGWEGADAETRVGIVQRWVEGGERYGSVISKPVVWHRSDETAEQIGITPPLFAATSDGGVHADFWVINGWNIAGRPMYQHRTLTFDADGTHVR